MERLIAVVVLAWVAVMGVGIVIALMPLILFVVGFLGMILLLAFLGRLVARLVW